MREPAPFQIAYLNVLSTISWLKDLNFWNFRFIGSPKKLKQNLLFKRPWITIPVAPSECSVFTTALQWIFFSWMQWSILKLQILTFIKFFNQSDSFWQITHWINYQTLKTESDWSRNSDLYFWNWWALHPAGPNIRRGKIRSGWRISFCFLPNWWQNKWLPICNSFKSFAKSHGNGLIFLFLQLAICFPIFEFLSSFFNTLLNTL